MGAGAKRAMAFAGAESVSSLVRLWGGCLEGLGTFAALFLWAILLDLVVLWKRDCGGSCYMLCIGGILVFLS